MGAVIPILVFERAVGQSAYGSLGQGLTLRYPEFQHHGPGAVQACVRGSGKPQGEKRPAPGPPGALPTATVQDSGSSVRGCARDAK